MVGNWVLDQQFPVPCDEKRANKFRRPTFISMFGIIFFYYSASGLVDLATLSCTHTASHISMIILYARQIKTNIHGFFLGLIIEVESWHGFFYKFLFTYSEEERW